MASPLANANPLSLGTPGVSGGIFGGPAPLPGEFTAALSEVPDLASTADALKGYGGPLVSQGGAALSQAQQGILTAPQQAELQQYQTGLTNQARQQFYNMGRTPDKDTAFISQTADIDAKVNAMAQQEIQTTIQLGLGELSAGSSFFGQSLGFDQAALNTLVQAGNAQLQQDKEYSDSLTSAFSTIGKLFGTIGGAIIGGPAGAAIGGTLFGAGGGVIDGSVGGGGDNG